MHPPPLRKERSMYQKWVSTLVRSRTYVDFINVNFYIVEEVKG